MTDSKNDTAERSTEKDRTSVRCAIDAWKIFALHPRMFLRPLWLYFLPAALAFTVLCPASLSLMEKYALSHPLTLTDFLWPTLALALFAFFSLYRKAAVLLQIAHYKRENTLPEGMQRIKGGDIHKAVLRVLRVNIPIYIIGIVLTAGTGYATLEFSRWCSLAFLPVFLIFPFIALLCEQRIVVYQQKTGTSLKAALTLDMRSYGSYFVIALLAMIPLGLFVIVCFLPSTAVLFSWYYNIRGMMMGDECGQPAYFSYIILFTSFLSYYLGSLALTLHTWALALKSVRQQ